MARITALLSLGLALAAGAAEGQRIFLFEDDNFRGQQIAITEAMPDLQGWRWNDKASSLRVESGEWEVCRDANFRNCVRLSEQSIASLGGSLRMNDAISSLRPIRDDQPRGQQRGQQSILLSGQGHGVHLSDVDPLMLESVQVDLGGQGEFVLDTSGEGRNRLAGTWRSDGQGLAQVQVTSFNGARAAGSGRVEFSGDRLIRVVIDGGVWRISFTTGRGNATKMVGDRVTCESQAGGLTFCPVDTQSAVSIERKLGGTQCTYNRTWSWHREGIWVDNGCRGEFKIGREGGRR